MKRNAFRIFEICFALTVIAYAAWLAYKQGFYWFPDYDDEGYVIQSLLHYVKDGGLYTTTFAQYGPFYFYCQQFMHGVFDLPFTHDGGRTLTLIYWLASAAIAAIIVYGLTRRVSLSSLGFFGTLMISVVLKREPGHPQEIILLLTQTAISLALLAKTKPFQAILFLLGTIGAFLCLTKINIGIFFLAALFFSVTCLMQRGRMRSFLLSSGFILAVILPAALMKVYLLTWAQSFCFVATMCIFVVLYAAMQLNVNDPFKPRELLLPLGGFLTGAGVIIGGTLLQGVTPSALMDGVLWSALRHPYVFYRPLLFSPGAIIVAASLTAVVTAAWSFPKEFSLTPSAVGFCKLAVGGIAIITLIYPPPHPEGTSQINLGVLITVCLLPLLHWQAPGESAPLKTLFPRLMLTTIIAFELLQAYPVAGSQIGIGLAPAICWACVLIFDGFVVLQRSWAHQPALFRFPVRTAWAAIILALTSAVAVEARLVHFDVRDLGANLDLPGAEHLHVTPVKAKVLRDVTASVRKNCDMLFTMPGMNSFNLWSGVPTPNGLNMTGWMTAFTVDQQQAIVKSLRAAARPCVVYNAQLLRFWMPSGQNVLATSPIAQYVRKETKPLVKIADYELRVPKLPVETAKAPLMAPVPPAQ